MNSSAPDYEAAKRKLLETGPMEPGMIDVISQLIEAQQVNTALLKTSASQHATIMRQEARIIDLLRFNNEFEERARRAEREVARLRGVTLVDPT